MATGTVKWFNDVKGYGFKTLKEGQKVTYDLKVGEKGKQADNIKPA